VAESWRCKPSEVVFTSGGTESNNLAIFGSARLLRSRGRHIITSAIEHHAVLQCCEQLERREGFHVTCLPGSPEGRIDPEALASAIRPDTILVSLMAANNEIGTIQPVANLGAICQERGVVFHTDAVQWFGKESFADIHQFHADLVSACAHKYYGPKGAGALFVRSPLKPEPILFGGSHENERRAGTENLAAVAGFAEATARFVRSPVFQRSYLEPLTERLLNAGDRLRGCGVTVLGSRLHRLANTVSLAVEGCDNLTLLAALDLEGICASSGSACSAGSLQPSHILRALGLPHPEMTALVRFSLGRESTFAEIERVEAVLPQIISRAQNREQLPNFM
jgi:cysteine desulfurase